MLRREICALIHDLLRALTPQLTLWRVHNFEHVLPSSQQLVYRASWTRRFDQDIPWPDGSFEAHPGPVVRMVGGEVLSGRKVRETERERERERKKGGGK